jgi:sugar phosphate isomerase/epimerase
MEVKIAVSSWSLHNEFFQSKMNMVDFIRIAKEEFGVNTIEMVHWMVCELDPEDKEIIKSVGNISELKTQEEKMEAFGKIFGVLNKVSLNFPKNLDKIKKALDQYGVEVVNMPIDYGNISQLDEEKRKADLAVIKIWIDVAATLGSKGARVNTGSQPEGVFDLSIPAASYRELAEYAETKGVAIVLENHGGMSADPKNILKLFELVNHPNFRICPDFGNFAAEIRYEAIDMIFNNPILVHAKAYSFDEKGSHNEFDYDRCMEITNKHNYKGYYSVEFEGTGDQFEGIQKTITLLKRYI